jgi:hypothetical protein
MCLNLFRDRTSQLFNLEPIEEPFKTSHKTDFDTCRDLVEKQPILKPGPHLDHQIKQYELKGHHRQISDIPLQSAVDAVVYNSTYQLSFQALKQGKLLKESVASTVFNQSKGKRIVLFR